MKYLTRKNIGWAATAVLAFFLLMSSGVKLFGGIENINKEMGTAHIQDWIRIIGVGELLSVIIFIIPKTMRLGTVLLSTYFGGAILFHMAHPDPVRASFLSPALFLVAIWITSWIRGNELIKL
jgi:hypothetical protein